MSDIPALRNISRDYSACPARNAFTCPPTAVKIIRTTRAFATAASTTLKRKLPVNPGWAVVRPGLSRRTASRYTRPLAIVARNAAANGAPVRILPARYAKAKKQTRTPAGCVSP